MKKLLLLTLFVLISFSLTACSIIRDRIGYDYQETTPYYMENVTVCYNIFPISYADGTGDGYGDLIGIKENLDYLSDILDIDCIWLNPINPSPTYHKYDVTDYYDIDPQFGTMEDFEALITEAADRDIKIIMDLVINHSSYDHPWFVESRTNPNGRYRDWYIWNDLSDETAFPNRSGWYQFGDEYYYASFWSRMPEFNFDNRRVRTEMKNIAEFWLEKGVGGFRIDAARHIYDLNEYPRGTDVNQKNIDWFIEFNHFVKSVDEDAIIIGEVWTTAQTVARFYAGMDSTFNFDFSVELITALQSGRDTNGALDSLIASRELYADVREDFIDSVFLTNHDQNRIMSQLSRDMDRARLAAQILFTMPGIAWIYYGEEIGMTGVKPDESIRQPFIWGYNDPYNTESKPGGIHDWDNHNQTIEGVWEQLDDPNSLLRLYIDLIALRKDYPALAFGDIYAVANNKNHFMAYVRSEGEQQLLVIHNLSGAERTIQHDASVYDIVYQSHDFVEDDNMWTFQPRSTVILSIDETVTLTRP